MLTAAFHPIYCHPLSEGHRFPMLKYELLAKELVVQDLISSNQFIHPRVCDDQVILLTHQSDYLHALNTCSVDQAMIRRIGFPMSELLVKREKTIMQGTIDCALAALKYGVSLNIAGGTHHAFANKGEGFCILNDLAIAANYLITFHKIERILIVDLDVHQGNGTASIFKNNSNVITFSMHGANNYPFHKEKSDLDIALTDGTDDATYLKLLDAHLHELIFKHQPQFMFYQCGVDILSTDKFGKLNITPNGCKKRDELVFTLCHKFNIPIVAAMGGGYSPEIRDIVTAHLNTFRAASEIFF